MTTDLADHLRALPNDELGALLQLRPDLLTPMPTDSVALAARAQSRVSVGRALDELDQFTLEILDAARLTEQPSEAAIIALVCAPASSPTPVQVKAAISRLRDRFLLFGTDDDLHVVSTVEEISPPYPAGLGRPAAQLHPEAEDLVNDAAKVRRTLMSAPPNARAVLDRLAEGPPIGTTNTPTEAVTWLVEHRLLVQTTPTTVELPRELGLLLRRDAGPLGQLHPEPPTTDRTSGGSRERSPAPTSKNGDQAGAGSAMSLVRHVEDLVNALDADPPSVLRAGGMGVLPLRRVAKVAGLSEPIAAVMLETAYAAGLIGDLELPTDTVYLPAAGFDQWRTAPLAQRWSRLAIAWLSMQRRPGLAGQRDEKDRPLTTLGPSLEKAALPRIRRAVLNALAEAEGALHPDELLELLRWHAPRRMRGRETIYREVLDEAALLGVTGVGMLTSYGRELLSEKDSDDPLGLRPEGSLPPEETPLVRALAALLPPPVEHLLVQADLTIVVPGPPESTLASELDLVAEHESGGGANVYRVTTSTVRRALDAGYAASDLHSLFERRSRTPIPQALTYLIDDAARTHGGLRTGAAGAYLRSDDETLIATVLADRNLAGLQLRRIAPTVLITPYPSGKLLGVLRDSGYSPVPEDASGAAVLTRPKARRAPSRTPVTSWEDPLAAKGLTLPHLQAIVEDVRRGDARMRAAGRAPAELVVAAGQPVSGLTAVQAHSQALAILQQAVREKHKVWVGYVDSHGAPASRLLRPVSIGGGYLRAEDERTQTLHTLALHRITAAVPAE